MADDANQKIGNVASPCVRNCCLDENDICIGCRRSISEIVGWSKASENERLAILLSCRLRSSKASTA